MKQEQTKKNKRVLIFEKYFSDVGSDGMASTRRKQVVSNVGRARIPWRL